MAPYTLPRPPSLLDLCRYQYGSMYSSEYDALYEMRDRDGLTAAVDTRTGDITFHIGLVPVVMTNGGYVIHYAPLT